MKSRSSKSRALPHGLERWLYAATLVSLASCVVGDEDMADPVPAEEASPAPQGTAATAHGPITPAVDRKRAPFVPGQVLVRFKSGTNLAAAFSVHSTHKAQFLRTYRLPSNLHLVQLPTDLPVEKALDRYRRDPNVLYAEPNYRYRLLDTTPNDPRFEDLWGMNNTGQTGGAADADINAPEAWDITAGSPDVVIGVLDTGIDYLHEDLAANVFVNLGEVPGNGIDDDANGYIDDIHGIDPVGETGDPMDTQGHGTHVSGTIAGRGNNEIGVAGVSWNTTVVGCKAFGELGAEMDDILQCMDYFLQLKTRAENPVNIVATNNSWGGGPLSQALYDAIDAHRQAGMLFVAAAGNDYGKDTDAVPHYPSAMDLDNIIAVAATDHDDALAAFSNFGRRTVDVGAPGAGIVSTLPGNNYAAFDGTSMATPHVSGLVALLEAQDPSRTPQQIKNLILTGGQEVAGTTGRTLSGRRIRADGSMNCQDQVLFNRFAPAATEVMTGVGMPMPLGVLHIDCDAAMDGAQSVTVAETDEVIELVDASGSGRFEGVFTPAEVGTYTLLFSSGDTVQVTAIGNYEPAHEVPLEYREIAGTELGLADDDSAEITSPFPIPFGGGAPGMMAVHVGSNGVIGMAEPVIALGNEPLPTPVAESLVAPLWDDLNPGQSGRVAYEVLGEEPARELVIEWRDVPRFSNVGAATFQVVFFENSPNILFNYLDVTFDDPLYDGGANATVGVQVARGVAQHYSTDEASLRDGTALLFAMGQPMAVAGPNQAVRPGAEVILDGSASQDFDGTIVSYEWTQTAGEIVALQGAGEPVATFTAPQNPGTLTFQLEVVDDEDKRSIDIIDVVVNLDPIADAGADFMLGNNLQGTLDGTASYDPDGVIAGYRWTQLGGEPVTLANGDTPMATFTAPASSQYLTFELVVTDEHGFTDRDVVVVEVFHNELPVASAGDDRLVRPGTMVSLDGSSSVDPDGSIVAYDWQVTMCATIKGPCALEILDAATATPRIVMPDAPGVAHITLTVTDDAGATASDGIVLGLFRQAPTAVANLGQGCATGGSLVTLDGTASSDPDGRIVAYQWAQIAGPAVVLAGASTAVASFTAPAVATSLIFELTVTDDDGLRRSTNIDVPVAAPPVAAASASAMAATAGATVTLDGALSQNAVSYRWQQTSGPTAELSDPTAASPSFVVPQPSGPYEVATFTLTVADACGATSTDTVSIVMVAGN